jgi:ribonuclease HI
MLYASEFTWNGGKRVEREYQLAINQMGRASLGAFRFVAAESRFTLGRTLLDHQRARFAQRLHARPRDGQGREGDPRAGELGPHLTHSGGRRHRPGSRFPGRTVVEARTAALQTASEWRRRETVRTDGSRQDDGRVGVTCVWRTLEGWTGCRYNLGTNKEVFDAETFAIYQALRALDQRQESGHQYTVFVDSTSAIDRMRRDTFGPGQHFAVAAIEVCSWILARDNEVTTRWVPAQSGVSGNEVADEYAKATAVGSALGEEVLEGTSRRSPSPT